MRKIRVVLGSNDGETIIPDHMGTAKDFYIFDLFEDGRSVLVEKRENTSPAEDENESTHGDVRKLKSAMGIFEDCDIVLGRRASPNFVRMRDNTGFQPVVTRVGALSGSMHELAESFEEIHDLVERRKQGERPQAIPIIGRTSER
ncbi:MAG: hypothetical protein JW918_04410 [Anaerolineae bacterium]|nr:hypothetical protein [Anaerolineae bacterium]